MLASFFSIRQGIQLAGMGSVDLENYLEAVADSGWTPSAHQLEVPAIGTIEKVQYRPDLNLHFKGELAELAAVALRVGIECSPPGYFKMFALPAKDVKGFSAPQGNGRVSKLYVPQSDDGETTEIILVYSDSTSRTGWVFHTGTDGLLKDILFMSETPDKKTVLGQWAKPTPESEEVFNAEKKFWLDRLAKMNLHHNDAASSMAFQRLARVASLVGGAGTRLPAYTQVFGLPDQTYRTLRTDQNDRYFSLYIVSETPATDIMISYRTIDGGTIFLTNVNGELRQALSTDFKDRYDPLGLTPQVKETFEIVKALWLKQEQSIFGSPHSRNASF
jgi:hypothetical protein